MADSDLPSPFSPSPSPSSFAPTATCDRPISWHFPGPSSRYHTRERERPAYSRFKSATTTPIGPSLSTERRAHRRTQSSAHIAYADRDLGTSYSGQPTPPASESGRSPLLRKSLSRLPSYKTYTSTRPIANMGAPGPLTPAKHAHAPMYARLQDSPFSDYFTDDARSVNTPGGVAYDAPSSETQALLVRLNMLQAQLMRSGEFEHETLNIVGRKLGEIDIELGALHSQTRMPPEMDDSGLFMDEEEEEDDEEQEADNETPGNQLLDGPGLLGSSLDRSVLADEERSDITSEEHKKVETDSQLLKAQRILESVTKAQEELRKRHAELVELNHANVLQIEDREAELERLRSENEGLRSDLGFDHSELLFLRLQLKALEVESEVKVDVPRDEQRIRSAAGRQEATDNGIQRSAKRGDPDEMERWRRDWHDVDARFKRRRGKYGVLSADEHRTLGLGKDREGGREEEEEDEGGEWSLEMVNEGDGRSRVSSVIIKRLDSASPASMLGLDGAADDDDDDEEEEVVPETEAEGKKGRIEKRSVSCQTDLDAEPAITPSLVPLETTRDRSTQTDCFPILDYEDSFAGTLRGYSAAEDLDSEIDDDECAITTSPTTPGQLSPVLGPQTQALPPVKNAWRELWRGLSELAGMQGEEEGEEGSEERR